MDSIQEPARSSEPRRRLLPPLVSIVPIPLGVLILFSFGGQLDFGPFALVLEWVLARFSTRPLRVIWSVLAGLLLAEIVYLVIDLYLPPLQGLSSVLIAVFVGAAGSILFIRTATTKY